MTNKEMVTMKKPDSQLRLYLPKELCDRAGIASGRPVILSGTEDGIYISSAKAAEQECVLLTEEEAGAVYNSVDLDLCNPTNGEEERLLVSAHEKLAAALGRDIQLDTPRM